MKTTIHELPGLPAILEQTVGGVISSFRFQEHGGVGGVVLARAGNGELLISRLPYHERNCMLGLGTWDRVLLAWHCPLSPARLPRLIAFLQRFCVAMDRGSVALLAAAASCTCQDVLEDLADGATGRDREMVTTIAEGLR